jgi:hypothetical protein
MSSVHTIRKKILYSTVGSVVLLVGCLFYLKINADGGNVNPPGGSEDLTPTKSNDFKDSSPRLQTSRVSDKENVERDLKNKAPKELAEIYQDLYEKQLDVRLRLKIFRIVSNYEEIEKIASFFSSIDDDAAFHSAMGSVGPSSAFFDVDAISRTLEYFESESIGLKGLDGALSSRVVSASSETKLELIEDYLEIVQDPKTVSRLLGKWVVLSKEENSQKIIDWALSVDGGIYMKNVDSVIVEKAAENNLDLGVSYINRLLDLGSLDRASYASKIFAAALMNEDPVVAFKWAADLPDSFVDKEETLFKTFHELASKDIEKASDIINNESDQNIKDILLQAVRSLN